MFGLQAPELIIILLILLVLFGASRLRGLGGALGGSISEFKKAVRPDEEPTTVTTVKTIETVDMPSGRTVEKVERTDRQV